MASSSRKTPEEKQIIKNVDSWLKEPMLREKLNKRTGTNDAIFREKNRASLAAQICGVSKSYVEKLRTGDIPIVPNKVYRGRPQIPIDDFDKLLLSRITLGFYRRSPPELPTLEKIHEEAMNGGFPACSVMTIQRQLKKLGFVFKIRNKKMQVYQRMDVVARRHRVLRQLTKLRAEGVEIFYQDETWLNTNHTRQFCWQREISADINNPAIIDDPKEVGGLNVPCGAGKRLIVNHIGSENGFLEACKEVFLSKKNTVDYHQEMNSVHFEDWWVNKVLPSLPDNSAVVIDNASYHSRITDETKKPTTASLKADILSWLQARGVDTPAKVTKVELLELVRDIHIIREYALEKLTEAYCQEHNKRIQIVRLPVGHSELNAIELIWAQAKNEVARKKTKFTLTAAKEAMDEALANVTAADWKKCIRHTIKFFFYF